ncbi:MgtC/SapB family protein [Glacieibacterium frigidum]|uniref:MgtC/SapB family protein n=1 Tax=Glacieibacterium frigidum TaxID=2593303 RepID=UPI001F48F439|nr:MgtC/SapB family protein [Glacieibacterium frigidum]
MRGLAVALGIGLLVGIERGWQSRDERRGSRVAGLRTFALLGFGGGIAAVLAAHGAAAVAAVLVAGATVALLIGYRADARRDGQVSATEAIAALLTIGCGYLAASGMPVVGAGVAAVMVCVLALRTELHRLVAGFDDTEIKGIARLSVLTLVVLPLLPDRGFGPYAAWNPHQIWLVVVVVSALSLLGYVAVRRLGAARGTLAAAAAGATVSSTAVTAALARQLAGDAGSGALVTAGIAVASAVMLARTLIMTALFAPFALLSLATVIGPAMLVSAGWAFVVIRRCEAPGEAVALPVGNPFDLRPALILAGLVAALALVSRAALARFGDAGLAVALAITGAMDVDSAILTMHGLPAGSVGGRLAGLILVGPILANTLVKAGLTVSIGGWRHGWRAALPLVASAAVGLAALALLWFA